MGGGDGMYIRTLWVYFSHPFLFLLTTSFTNFYHLTKWAHYMFLNIDVSFRHPRLPAAEKGAEIKRISTHWECLRDHQDVSNGRIRRSVGWTESKMSFSCRPSLYCLLILCTSLVDLPVSNMNIQSEVTHYQEAQLNRLLNK